MIGVAKPNERDYQVDNIRAILIFLVVLGHLLPADRDGSRGFLYSFIYSFHMPVFVYISGRYARYDRIKLLKHYIWPYVFFQTGYFYFRAYILHEAVSLQFTTPYWILWYLMTMATYLCLLPLLKVQNRKQGGMAIAIAFVAALAVGFDSTIYRYLSLSRTIVFLPFFLLGHYRDLLIDEKRKRFLHKSVFVVCCGMIIILLEYLICISNIPEDSLHFTTAYPDMKAMAERLVLLVSGACWILFLFQAVPNRKFGFFSIVGRNTMPIYLLHGFFVLWVTKSGLFHYEAETNYALAVILSVMIVIVLGNQFLGKLFRRFF